MIFASSRLIGRLKHPSFRASHSFTTFPFLARQYALPASYYRGGTSRAVIFHRADLPSDRAAWPAIFRGVLGSPDPNGRQLDGLGGGISSLSKVCVVEPVPDAERNIADVAFTMVAVGIENDLVDFSSNCGNMTAAIGPWAWDHAMFTRDDSASANGQMIVKILNTNTGKVIRSTFEVQDGKVQTEGDMAIAGVAGTGSPIQLDFLDPAGSKTGKLLPTGNVIDTLDGTTATCIDAGNPCIFVRAVDVGADGTLLPKQFDADVALREKLERIRRAAALQMGLAQSDADIPGAIPKICLVAPRQTSTLLSGDTIKEHEMDLLARAVSMGNPHRAIPITVALCLAVAAKVQGSVVYECTTQPGVDAKGITIAHASGTIVVSAKMDGEGHVQHATLFRTARRLMEGTVYWDAP